ncbi:peptidoglycan DD-metalloendopeptidase family protein [Deinococcus sp. QL22]|uniref:peptidoglycan DD-metalloendopeptidase family protein n=1 Tax=Deinococcus sp. QL22 TaxID=2939437 RepID=UPI002016D199|nr:peptidoglycan DD-metalloendopeptidase family protein [Deinococcus sp. QL22]UQN06060.1 peptidoglycan DD-metalloendopeptidase family protein [Deinococcus sp. QL22]
MPDRSRPNSASLALTLLASLSISAHAAPLVPDPAALLLPAPAVRLERDETAPTLLIVTDTRQTSAAVARRYGVPAQDVDLLPTTERGVRVRRVTLAPQQSAAVPVRPASVIDYTVRPGETLDLVARRHRLTLIELLGANLERESLDDLKAGEIVRVPTAETGVLVRIKPGQTALSLIAGYGADLQATAQANSVLPTELRVGDEVLLPGILAEDFHEQLVERRENEEKAEAEARILAQYTRFTQWKKDRERARLQERYAKQAKYEAYLAFKQSQERARLEQRYANQAKYEAYLAWKTSPERQSIIAAYQRQVQFEAAQAARRAREREAQQQAAANRAAAITTATSSNIGRDANRVTAGGGLSWPMRSYRLTSRYAERDIPFHQQVFHGGIDLAAPTGTPIYAAASGSVTQSGYGAYGLNVFTDNGNSTLVYGHMSRTAVSAGQTVSRGQLIGYVGCSGICTGPHLHFEIRLGGQTVDPLALLP